MRADAERWDARYTSRMTGEPAMPVGLGRLPMRRGGICLDVACGLGEQAIWAAQQGYEVVALDISEVAISAVNAAAIEFGVRDRIRTHVHDLDDGLPAEYAGRCALVICQRYRDRRLYPQLVYMAEPDGIIVVSVLSTVGLDGEPGEHHASPGELIDAFRELDVEVLRSVEADGLATIVLRRR